MKTTDQAGQAVIKRQDVARWITFSGFWGFVYYLLAFVGLLVGQRRQPARVDMRTTLVGMGVHVAAFVTFGSLISAIGALVRGKSTTRQAREQISRGNLERTIVLQGLGGAVGSAAPFALAVGSLRAAEQITGKTTLVGDGDTDWLRAVGTTALLSGVTATAVSRIAAWVARDARVVTETRSG